MPTQYAPFTRKARRLLWLLAGVLLLIGALSIFVSAILPGAIDRWLRERGLEAKIDHVQISLPRLHAQLNGVRARNQQGRGFHAREASLSLSWWKLLRGRLHVETVELEGAYLDIDSEVRNGKRYWEIGGIRLGAGEARDRQWRLQLAGARLRNSELCYQHKPQWKSSSCLRFGDLRLEDFLLAVRRRGDRPMDLEIAAGDLRIINLIAQDSGQPDANTALVDLQLEKARFVRPRNLLSAEEIRVREFGSCPPARWAEALPALSRLIGHCGTAQRLQLEGTREKPLQFSFGAAAEIYWRRANGQGILLRHKNRRWANWRAETLALSQFQYSRAKDHIRWQSAGASTFDWCPTPWRNREHHYCVRAGTLQLPQTVTFDWAEQFSAQVAAGRLQQTQLLDLASPKNTNPITAHQAELGALRYSAKNRLLEVDSLLLDGAAGCIPMQLWKGEDHCLKLKSLRLPQDFQVAFSWQSKKRPLGFSSGPLSLAELDLSRGGEPQLRLQKLHWQRANLRRNQLPWLIQDVGLQNLNGCLPGALSKKLSPLCAKIENLLGRGSFAYQAGAEGYLSLGELQLETLQLADSLLPQRGLQLKNLHTGSGYFRRDSLAEMPGELAAAPGTAASLLLAQDDGSEKGLLPGENKPGETGTPKFDGQSPSGSPSATAVPADTQPNLQLQFFLLSQLQGCLPNVWMRLLYGDRSRMPGCFQLRNLRQHKPLSAGWQRGLSIDAGEVSVEQALVQTSARENLLQVSGFRLPQAKIRRAQNKRSGEFLLPGFALDKFYGCLPEHQKNLLNAGCLDLEMLRLGSRFQLQFSENEIDVNLSGLLLQRLLLTDSDEQFIAHIEQLMAPQLQVYLPRGQSDFAEVHMQNLQAARLDACLPRQILREGPMPRCISAQNLRSTSTARGSGLALEQLQIKEAPVGEPTLSVEKLLVEEVALADGEPAALLLRGLALQNLSGCGLSQWLPQNLRDALATDCLRADSILLSGDNRIALGASAQPLQFGPLQTSSIELLPAPGEDAQQSLQSLQWRALRWAGGSRVQVEDLHAQGFQACLEQQFITAQTASWQRSDNFPAAQIPHCVQLRELHIFGSQQLNLGLPFSSDGRIELLGVSFRSGEQEHLGLAGLQLERLTLDGGGLSLDSGQLAGLSGCIPQSWLGGLPFAPCYQLGRVDIKSSNRIDFGGAAKLVLQDISIAGLELSQPDYPAGSRAQLLQVEAIDLASLSIGGGEMDAQELQLQGIASCIPRGYIRGINHCMVLDNFSLSGRYQNGTRALELAELNLQSLKLVDAADDKLIQADSLNLQQARLDSTEWRALYFELAGIRLFGRHEREPEFDEHAWNGEVELLRMNQLQYSRGARELEIASVEITRPQGILLRDNAGSFPIGERIANFSDRSDRTDRGEQINRTESRRAARAEVKPIQYRIGELYVDRGKLTWLDRSREYDADLPIRRINLLLRNMSSHPQDPPTQLLLNARPGGLGELQLAGDIDFKATKTWDADLYGYIVAANLIPAGPYIVHLLGYRILQGQLDAELDIHIEDNQVNAHADMVLNKIKLRRVRDREHLDVKKTLIPLHVALWLLKDGRGNVSFGMPVTGELFDPQFSFSFIFSDLLQRAIMEALFSYFTPMGFYTLGRLAWARFRAVHLDPVPFDPGSAELSAEGEEQLNETVTILKERPDTRPGICGVANARDWDVLHPGTTLGNNNGSREAREDFYRHPPQEIRAELERLAHRRSRQVQRFLLQSGFTPEDFIQCAPDYNGRDFDQPRVELSN